MTVPIRLQEVPLAQIDLAEAAGEMTAAPALDRLAASLQEVGLINPPWLRSQPGGQRFQVVTGARRLKAAADLGWQEITVRLVPEGTPDFYCLLVHVMDNAFTRGFNLREQAALAVRLLSHCDRETVAARYLPYLGLPPSQAHLARLVKTAGLEAPWQELAADGRLALTAAARLADWDPEARAAAWPFLDSLRLSQSKQEEMLDQVALLARREGLSPAAVLARDELRGALTDPDRTPQERTEVVRRQLYRVGLSPPQRGPGGLRDRPGPAGVEGHSPGFASTRPPPLKAPIFSWKSNFRTPRNCNNSWGKSAA